MILVTGAGGTVGKELVRRLLDAGARFRAGYHSKEKAEAARASGIETAVIDFGEPETLREPMRGVEQVFLLSGWSPAQAEQEINVAREAARAGVRRLVKLSVWGAAQESFSFARIHRQVEREIEASGLSWTFLRPNGFMQNLSNFFAGTIRAEGAFYLPAGQARISHIDVRDIAAVAERVLSEGGHQEKACELSGPEDLSYAEIADKISAAAGRKVAYVDVPAEAFRKGMIDAGTPAAYADAILDLIRYYIAGHASRVTPAVRQITGKDSIPFDRFARDHAAAFR